MFSHRYHHVVEWGDCDPAGIVFYPRFFAMFDAATASLLEAASGMNRAALIAKYRIIGWPMVDTQATFHQPVTFDDRITIASAVSEVGRSSFKIFHRLMLADRVCVEASDKRVWCARDTGGNGIQSVPVPEKLRLQLSS